MQVSPLSNGFGIRIEGVDVSRRPDDDALVAFAGRFGALFVHAQTSLLSNNRRKVMALSNVPGAERRTVHATQPAHVYRHKWTEGDLPMWDNTSAMLRRTQFQPDTPCHPRRAGCYLPEDRAVPF